MILLSCYQKSCSASVGNSSHEHSREQKFKLLSSVLSLKKLVDAHNLSFIARRAPMEFELIFCLIISSKWVTGERRIQLSGSKGTEDHLFRQHIIYLKLDRMANYIPYSGLFSRGVNFPEFPKWTRNSGNFILDC